jgi:hypothetical protein
MLCIFRCIAMGMSVLIGKIITHGGQQESVVWLKTAFMLRIAI